MDFFKLSICTASGAETPRLLIVQKLSRPALVGGQQVLLINWQCQSLMYENHCYTLWVITPMRCPMSYSSLAREPSFHIEPGSF